jgi:hypothetical protein
LGFVAHRSGRAGKALLAAGVMIAGLAMVLAANASTSPRGVGGTLSGSIAASQFPVVVDADVTIVNYTAPGFTWSEAVTFNFTISSTIDKTMWINITSAVLQPFLRNINVTTGLNCTAITLGVNPVASPGMYYVNIIFGNNATIVHEIWLGSNPIVSYSILFGALGFVLAIYVKVGAPKKAKGSSSGASGAAASAADDDTSTVTYVDQSQAPPGRIYCPECKKVIEEGSIFCPECGTRIPRYLRYHP